MKHTIPHDVSMELSRKAARGAFAAYQARFSEYNPTVTWKDDDHAVIGFRVKGVSLNGAVELRDHVIDLELDVPFLLRMFQSRAIQIIESEVRTWLDKARAGQL
jgi:hypothetical protein